MGDGGSQFLGFSLGVLSLVLTDPSHGPYSLLIALMIAGLPVLDTLGVMFQRGMEGRSMFLADKNHTHHKLLGAGLFHDEAVILIYFLQIALVSLACLLRFQDDGTILLVYSGLASLFFLFFLKIGSGSLILKGREKGWPIFRLSDRLKTSRWIGDLPHQLLGILIPLFMAAIVFASPVIPVDFGLFSLGLLGLLVLGVLFYRKGLLFWVRAGLYVGGAFGIFLSERNLSSFVFPLQTLLNLFFLVLAGLMILTIWANKKGPFQTTPLDYLIIFIVLILSVMMKMEAGGVILGLLAAKLLLFFYACEILLNRYSDRLAILSGVSIWTLVVLGLRGWMP